MSLYRRGCFLCSRSSCCCCASNQTGDANAAAKIIKSSKHKLLAVIESSLWSCVQRPKNTSTQESGDVTGCWSPTLGAAEGNPTPKATQWLRSQQLVIFLLARNFLKTRELWSL